MIIEPVKKRRTLNPDTPEERWFYVWENPQECFRLIYNKDTLEIVVVVEGEGVTSTPVTVNNMVCVTTRAEIVAMADELGLIDSGGWLT